MYETIDEKGNKKLYTSEHSRVGVKKFILLCRISQFADHVVKMVKWEKDKEKEHCIITYPHTNEEYNRRTDIHHIEQKRYSLKKPDTHSLLR
mmetsp:Transcript_31066/g.52577  ORF Transcript_31066/g.52577 Transcript_31066/m.52577 type:complete len:92 (+) Transcript_31066:1672-1947(+)